AAMMARIPADGRTDPVDQVPQWLFAYDPAGAVAYRALALLTAAPPAELSGGEPLPKGLDPFALRFPVRTMR
ncbi:MAG: hypothetical protein QOJ30_279, partial [Pseudonocardiales bacterium]|nr:hypothetical protein [Pseudonocardiales bacterium]